MKRYRYYLIGDWRNSYDDTQWDEVSEAEFVKAERAAGFRNTRGNPDKPATGGFSGGGVSGRVRYE